MLQTSPEAPSMEDWGSACWTLQKIASLRASRNARDRVRRWTMLDEYRKHVGLLPYPPEVLEMLDKYEDRHER